MLDFGTKWVCSECCTDKADVIYSQRGDDIVASHLDYGTKYDSEKASTLLKNGETYEVESVNIGRSRTEIKLKEFPGEKFNSVHFSRIGKVKMTFVGG